MKAELPLFLKNWTINPKTYLPMDAGIRKGSTRHICPLTKPSSVKASWKIWTINWQDWRKSKRGRILRVLPLFWRIILTYLSSVRTMNVWPSCLNLQLASNFFLNGYFDVSLKDDFGQILKTDHTEITGQKSSPNIRYASLMLLSVWYWKLIVFYFTFLIDWIQEFFLVFGKQKSKMIDKRMILSFSLMLLSCLITKLLE